MTVSLLHICVSHFFISYFFFACFVDKIGKFNVNYVVLLLIEWKPHKKIMVGKELSTGYTQSAKFENFSWQWLYLKLKYYCYKNTGIIHVNKYD